MTMVAQTTLFDTYAPVERYLRELQLRTGETPPLPMPLGAEDAYLLHLFVEMHPHIHAVFDLAQAATGGATTVLWGSQKRPCRVYSPAPNAEGIPKPWRELLRETLADSAGASSLELVVADSSNSGLNEPLSRCQVDRRPALAVAALAEDGSPTATLEFITSAHPRAIVLLLGLGRIGEDRRLAELLEWTRMQDRRLTAFRELSPFLAGSRLAALFSKQDAEVPETLKRIERLFTSNFDFLTLAQQVYTLSRANVKLETELKEAAAKHTDALDERDRLLREAQMKIAELDQAAQGWARGYEQMDRHAAWLEQRLGGIRASRSWRLVEGIRSVRQTLVPRNSFRERCGRYLMRWQRKLRGWLRPAA
jgi:hypothetical protein